MKKRTYDAWFGDGDTNIDVENAIKKHGKPNKIFYESGAFMAALIYDDKVICTGYDDSEYCHFFVMDDSEQ